MTRKRLGGGGDTATSPRQAPGVIEVLPQKCPLEMSELRFIKNELIAEQIIFCHCGFNENEVQEAVRVARVRNSGL